METPNNCYVYTFTNPTTGSVFYIGRGRKYRGRATRKEAHYTRARHGSYHGVHRYIRNLWLAGKEPTFQIYTDSLSYLESVQVEKNLIACIGLDKLTNHLASEEEKVWSKKERLVPDGRSRTWRTEAELNGLAKGRIISNQHQAKKVVVSFNNEDKVFDTLSAAAKFIGIDRAGVRYAIRNGSLIKGLYRVAYGTEPNNTTLLSLRSFGN